MQLPRRETNKDCISPWKPLDSGRPIEELLKSKVMDELILSHQKTFMSSKKSLNSKKRKPTLPVYTNPRDNLINIPRSSLKIFHKTMSDFRRNVVKHFSQTMNTKTEPKGSLMAKIIKTEQLKLLNQIIFVKKYAPFARKATIITVGNQKSQVTEQTNPISNSIYLQDSPSKQYFRKSRKKRNKTTDYNLSRMAKTQIIPSCKLNKDRERNKILTVTQLKQSFCPSATFFASDTKITRRTIKTRI